MNKLTNKKVQEIKNNLAYNYCIIDRVLDCLSITTKVESEYPFIIGMINEAIEGTLINSLYENKVTTPVLKRTAKKPPRSKFEYYDTRNNDESLLKSGETPAKADYLIDGMHNLFHLPVEIINGSRRMDLGIDVPEGIKSIFTNENKSNLYVIQAERFEEKKEHSGWIDYVNSGIMQSQIAFESNYRKSIHKKREPYRQHSLNEVSYNPLGINGLAALMHLIEQGFGIPRNYTDYIDDEVKEYIGKIIRKKIEKSKKPNANSNKLIEKVLFNRFLDRFVYHLFILFDTNDNRINTPDEVETEKARPKGNVYSLDSLIHSIADNTFDYFHGHQGKGMPIWRFLNQRNRSKKIYLNIDNIVIDVKVSKELNDFLDTYNETSYENTGIDLIDENELSLTVPMPLKLKKTSELLNLIVAVENLGHLSTMEGETRLVGVEPYKDRESIKFTAHTFLNDEELKIYNKYRKG